MKIFYTRKAAAQLKSLSRTTQERIIKKMRFYAQQDDVLKFAKRLTDNSQGEFRFRVGSMRLIFDIKINTIYILKIGNRDKIYE